MMQKITLSLVISMFCILIIAGCSSGLMERTPDNTPAPDDASDEVSGEYTPIGYIGDAEHLQSAVENNPVVPEWGNKLIYITDGG